MSRLFKADDPLDGQKGGVEEGGRESSASASSAEALSGAAGKLDKLKALKGLLEFDPGSAPTLKQVHSPQELMLFVYDVVLFKFLKLREIGLVSERSSATLDLLSEKLESFLISPDGFDPSGPAHQAEVLRRENEALKKEIVNLNSKYLKSGIISERELQLEEEVAYLKRRILDLSNQAQITRKKLSLMRTLQESVQSLRARNSLLGSKLEHQGRLLRSMAVGQPRQQELVSALEKLGEENKLLKTQVGRQSGFLEQVQTNLPQGAENRDMIQGLLAEHAKLRSELDQKEDRLEDLGDARPDESLVDNIERLHEENVHLRRLLDAKKSVLDLVQSPNADHEKDSARVVEMIELENQRLKKLLEDKREQIEVLSSGPKSRLLFEALREAREEKKRLIKENKYRHEIYQALEQEKQELEKRARVLSQMVKELRRSNSRLESNKQLVDSLKKSEEQHLSLKKEYSNLVTKFDIMEHENRLMSKKLQRMTAEYELLMKEYEQLFS